MFQHFHRDGLNAGRACASRARPSGAPALVDPLDISYLVVHNACDDPPEARAARKVVFFDLGASSGLAGVRGGVPAAMPQRGGSITASIPLFWRLYRERCLEFDEVWAWEVEPHVTEAQWWGELPPCRTKVRYPAPVAQDRRAARRGRRRRRRGHRQLPRDPRETVARGGFVVLKVDIDTPEIELNVVEAPPRARARRARRRLLPSTRPGRLTAEGRRTRRRSPTTRCALVAPGRARQQGGARAARI